jgi:7,8-dihydropterin-6-yl-methyl-4-(beta-D-ribofuranosyl)aminobenzene 5'-phosphate synthase
MKFTVLCDNNSFAPGIEASWGFSCFIEGAEKNVLFDTGNNPFLLLRNMKRLDIEPGDIDSILLSHMHWDHTGGLYGILENNSAINVFMLESFSRRYVEDVRKFGTTIVESEKTFRICRNVFSTGALGTSIQEQALIIRSGRGLVVITGCAHPGILTIIKRAREIIKEEVFLILGGFHLGSESITKIENVVWNTKKLGVRYAGPCHCTGEIAKELFQKEYGSNFINVGAGKVININDLK